MSPLVLKRLSTLRGRVIDESFSTHYRAWETLSGKTVSTLFLLDIVFMTRFYALSNLVETLLFLMFIIVPALRSEFVRTLKDPVVLFLMGFFGWILISGVWSDASIWNVIEDWWSWRKLLLLPIGLVLLSDERVFTAGCYIFLAVGIFFLCTAGYVWAVELGIFWERPYTHMLQNGNAQGVYFSILGAALVMGARDIKAKLIAKISMVTLGVLFLLFTAWLGSSRTGYVSFGIATIFSSLYWFSGQWRGAALGALIAICLLYISPTANQRVNQAITELSMGIADGGYSSSGSIRAVMWQNSLQIIGNNWILGTGAGGFQEEYAKTVEGVRGWRATITDDPHNQFLHIWAEYGIFGLAFFILFLVAVGCRARLSETFGLIALVTLLISCTAGTFNGVFGSSIEGRILFFTFAICLSALTNRRTIKRGSPISF